MNARHKCFLYRVVIVLGFISAILPAEVALADTSNQATAARIVDGQLKIGAHPAAGTDADITKRIAKDVSDLRGRICVPAHDTPSAPQFAPAGRQGQPQTNFKSSVRYCI